MRPCIISSAGEPSLPNFKFQRPQIRAPEEKRISLGKGIPPLWTGSNAVTASVACDGWGAKSRSGNPFPEFQLPFLIPESSAAVFLVVFPVPGLSPDENSTKVPENFRSRGIIFSLLLVYNRSVVVGKEKSPGRPKMPVLGIFLFSRFFLLNLCKRVHVYSFFM